jgi:hypothetical protein
MADQLENKTVDKRVVHRYLRKGIIEDRDWEKHVKGLPDLADQAAPVEASIEGEELEDEGGDDEGAA